MPKKLVLLFVILIASVTQTASQSLQPKQEFRGAWIATVINLDWPSGPGLSPELQRSQLIKILNELKGAGINAVFFQIRSESDAMYESAIEPWSFWLTGEQGKAPEPFYDPLEFAIAETHKRGMELHAWLNPYRADRDINDYSVDPTHVTAAHPDWIIAIGEIKVLNPGLPEVREYITGVVMDVVRRYDVDGVHFDDYFYPYPPNQISAQDASTFQNHSRGFTNRGDWRRDNVNLFIAMVQDSINSEKPYVKFGISPFGIWRNGVPSGIVGLDAYNVIYADAVAWLQQQIIDYLAPQLYWPFGGGQDYAKLQPWWASQANERHIYIGQAVYRIPEWSAWELPSQLRFNRQTPEVHGSIFFRALSLRENPRGFTDSLKINYHRYPALTPTLPWKELIAPNTPQNLRYDHLADTGLVALQWDEPAPEANGENAARYAIYRFEDSNFSPEDFNDPSNMVSIYGATNFIPDTPPSLNGPYYYLVTALDHNSNESQASNFIAVSPPASPTLAFPPNAAINQPDTVTLHWNRIELAASYHVQAVTDSNLFDQLVEYEMGLADTFFVLTGLVGQETYYWRVRAENAGGASTYSSINSFTTGFPIAPFLASPSNGAQNLPINPTLKWRAAKSATQYQLQIARRPAFGPSIEIDTVGIADTTIVITGLQDNLFYYWRVKASNALGVSDWSSTWQFRTEPATLVAEAESTPKQFRLEQNYPNPFLSGAPFGRRFSGNPETTIAFELPKDGSAHLVIYDILGRKIKTLIDGRLAAGVHQIKFNAADLPSGIYFYRLRFDNRQAITKRMLIVN